MNKIALGIAVVALATVAQAKVYRAGLAGGYLNAYDGNNYHTATVPDIGFFPGPEAGWSYGSNGSKTTYPPVWADNRTWRYHGQMYFDGGSYWFVEAIDDASYVAVDGVQVLKDATWDNNKVSSEVAPEAGWHEVEFRFGNGNSGAGVYDQFSEKGSEKWLKSHDKNEKLCGIGYATGTAPTKMNDCVIAKDPGDGSLFRVLTDEKFLTLDSIASIDGGYRITITATKACAGRVHAAASAGEAFDPTTWDWSSDELTFTDDALTQTVDLLWEGMSRPVLALAAEGEDEVGRFSEWSDPISLIPTPIVSASLGRVEATSATFNVVLDYPVLVVGDEPTTEIYAYVCELGSTVTNRIDLGVRSIGSNSLTVTDLGENAAYTVWFGADNGQSDEKFSNEIVLSTAGITVGCPSEVYECDVRDFLFTLSRPSGSEGTEVTVGLAWSGNTEAFVSPLPESVTLPVGTLTATVAVKTINNDIVDGDRSLTLTLQESSEYRLAPVHAATVNLIDDDSLMAEIVEWTGAAGDLKWETAHNWENDRVPRPIDSVKFVSTGLSSGNTVQISNDELIRELIIETTAAFTIAGTGVTLTLDGITRKDIEGTEGNHTLAVPTCLYAGSETNCIWDVAGSGAFVVNCDFTKTDGTYVYKTGAGTVEMRKQDQTFAGPWIIAAGKVSAHVGNAFRGSAYVGGGDDPATLDCSPKDDSIIGNGTIYVHTNGLFKTPNTINYNRLDGVYVYEGGAATLGGNNYFYNLYIWGGTVTGGHVYNLRKVVANAAAVPSRISTVYGIDGYNGNGIEVHRDQRRVVDLIMSGALSDGRSDHTMNFNGDGICVLKSNSSGLKSHTAIKSGTWYVDNPSEYGLGLQETTVAKGAKLGGVGFIGMKDSKPTSYATLSLADGSETSYATLSPGTVDVETGAHSNGTLTVARDSAHNYVSLGKYSHLEIGAGPRNRETKLSDVDKLMVYGELRIGENCTLDLVSNMYEDMTKIVGGKYTIVEAVDGITGTFANELKPKPSWKVNYITAEGDEEKVVRIDLTIPGSGLTVVIR